MNRKCIIGNVNLESQWRSVGLLINTKLSLYIHVVVLFSATIYRTCKPTNLTKHEIHGIGLEYR